MNRIADIVNRLKDTIFREKCVLLLTGNKESTVLLNALQGLDFSIVFIDTGYHFPEISTYMKNIDGSVDVIRNENAEAEPSEGMDACCAERKSEVLKQHLNGSGIKCLIVPFSDEDIECGIESSYLQGLDGIDIIRPLAGLTWENIWKMIKEEDVPFSSIYNKGYRIVDCSCCTTRHGRRRDDEHVRDDELDRETEEKLKDLGYM